MFCLRGVRYRDILNIERLEIPEGKVTCIVGESGSGKTTLLRLLNKLISYDKGEIVYKGRSLKDIDSVELRRRVVMLPQTPAIFPGTVWDNLLIGLVFSEKPLVGEKKLLEIMKMVHLDKGLDEDAEKLSGGEKQRLALGRVLLMDPEAFLLDKPSSALDEDTEEVVIGSLVRYARERGKTVVMVTHSKQVARSFSDIIVEVNHGRLVSRWEGSR